MSIVGDVRGAACEVREDSLGDVAGEVNVPVDPATGNGMHEVNVAADEVTEGGFGTEFGVVAQQLIGGLHEMSPV